MDVVVDATTTTTTTVRRRAFWASVVALVVVSWLARAATETGETSTSASSSSSNWFEDRGASVEDFARELRSRRSVDACARGASLGSWTVGEDACRGSAWTLASEGCGGAASVAEAFGLKRRKRKADAEARAWNIAPEVGRACGFGALSASTTRSRLVDIVGGKRFAFVGDSNARFAYASFIAATSEASADVSLDTKGEKHRDWEHGLIANARASFVWAPYAGDVVEALEAREDAAPDLVAVSTSLWHVLHEDNVNEYKKSMTRLGSVLSRIAERNKDVVIVWLDTPMIVQDKLTDDEKRRKFTVANLEKFAKVKSDQSSVKVVKPAGAAIQIKIADLSAACGPECSVDGVHQSRVVYDAGAQILLSILRARWR